MNDSLPLSVKTLHLAVCILDFTEPSSILRNPTISASSASFSDLSSIEASLANTGLEFIPRMIAATYQTVTKRSKHILYYVSSTSRKWTPLDHVPYAR